MSLSITCTSCGARFKAPVRAAGRTVICLKCRTRIVVPELPEAEPMLLEPAPPETAGPTVEQRRYALLTALLIAGAGVAFLLVITLLILVLHRQSATPFANAVPLNNPGDLEAADPANPMPAEPRDPELKPQPPPPSDRANRLAEIEAR